MYDKSNLEKKNKPKYTVEELNKMKNALNIIEDYKKRKRNMIKSNSIFGSFLGDFLDDYVNECEKILNHEYNLNKIIIPKEENKDLSPKDEPKKIQINVKPEKKEETFIDKLPQNQQIQINKLVNEFMNTVICPRVSLDGQKYKALYEGLANYSAWLYQHK